VDDKTAIASSRASARTTAERNLSLANWNGDWPAFLRFLSVQQTFEA
jgi:hypothetical protein